MSIELACKIAAAVPLAAIGYMTGLDFHPSSGKLLLLGVVVVLLSIPAALFSSSTLGSYAALGCLAPWVLGVVVGYVRRIRTRRYFR